jgi:glycosyltransferase involved in cell wall biosynthesis
MSAADLNHRMKNVLIVHQSAEMYGSDRVLLTLAIGMNQRGHFHPIVVLPCHGPLENALCEAGVEVHLGEVAKITRATFTPLGIPALLGKAWSSIGQIDMLLAGREVAFVHSNTLAVLAGAGWALRHRRPHLWHVHEIITSPRIARFGFPFMIRCFADRVVAISTQTRRWLVTEQPALAERCVIVFDGVPVTERPSDAAIAKFRASVGASDNHVVVTLAGRINRWKGQEVLIKAAALLKGKTGSDCIRFVIAGGPAPGGEGIPVRLQTLVRGLGLSNSFVFLEFVQDIWPVWFGTDIAVVPSTEPEPFGMVAIEAMAAGIPVVASAHGGLLDCIDHPKTGLLITPNSADALADAIAELAADPGLRARMGAAGRERQLRMFSMEQFIQGIETIYEGLQDRTEPRP